MCIDFVGGVRRQPYGSALKQRSFGVKNKTVCDMYALESDTYWPVRRARQTAQWPPPPPSGWAPGPGWGSLWGTAATCDSSLRAGRTAGGSRSGLLPRLCRHKQHVNVSSFKGLSCGNNSRSLSASNKPQHTIGSLQVHTSLYKNVRLCSANAPAYRSHYCTTPRGKAITIANLFWAGHLQSL